MSYFEALGIVAKFIGIFAGGIIFLFFPVITEEMMKTSSKYTKNQAEIARFLDISSRYSSASS